MDKLRQMLSGEDRRDSQAEEGGINEIIDASSLSWSTRLKGFIACFVGGFLLALLGTMLLFVGNIKAFCVFYTIGSIGALASTMFLMGPVNQIRKMCASTRMIASFVMILALFLTLWSALHWKKTGLTLIFLIVQFLAMTWYALSYIPYARDGVKKMLSGIC